MVPYTLYVLGGKMNSVIVAAKSVALVAMETDCAPVKLQQLAMSAIVAG